MPPVRVSPQKRRLLFFTALTSPFLWQFAKRKPEDTWQYLCVKTLPLRALSRAWGYLNNLALPVPMRRVVYGLWATTFQCRLDEADGPLESYANLASFFSRPLKPGLRPLDPAEMVSPVDGRIVVRGEVLNDKVEQVKGVNYSMSNFLGLDPRVHQRDKTSKLYYCVLYLAPGDYHRIHSSTDCSFRSRVHFPGELFPVAPRVARHIPNLFSLNERVALHGEWRHGFFSLTSVAAYNVGGVKIVNDSELQTNLRDKRPGSGPFKREYVDSVNPKGWAVKKGEEIARFELGSTVVLVFESNDFQFNVEPGQKVQLGQALGRSRKKKASA
jgi:phosphatidylserine decarboxylase